MGGWAGVDIIEYRFRPQCHIWSFLALINGTLNRVQREAKRAGYLVKIFGPVKKFLRSKDFCLAYRVLLCKKGTNLTENFTKKEVFEKKGKVVER